jgi:hypothetical protein
MSVFLAIGEARWYRFDTQKAVEDEVMKRLFGWTVLCAALCGFAGAQSARVAVDKASLRGRPADDARIVDAIARSTEVEVIKVSGLWYLVQTPELAGWMSIKDLESIKPAASAEAKATVQPQPVGKLPDSGAQAQPGSKTYTRGPRGGCYYLNSSGKKTYVAHELCG